MKQSKPIRVVIYAVLIFFTLVFLYPVFCMLTMSLMTNFELNQFPPKWFPDAPQWSNFKNIIGAFGYYGENGDKAYVWVFLKNTVFIIAAQAVGMVLSMTLCAYGFSKIKFKGRQIAFGVMLATIMIPGSVTMIPLFKEFIYSQNGGINRIQNMTDKDLVNFVVGVDEFVGRETGAKWLGDVDFVYRIGGGDWQEASTAFSRDCRRVSKLGEQELRVDYDEASAEEKGIRHFKFTTQGKGYRCGPDP